MRAPGPGPEQRQYGRVYVVRAVMGRMTEVGGDHASEMLVRKTQDRSDATMNGANQSHEHTARAIRGGTVASRPERHAGRRTPNRRWSKPRRRLAQSASEQHVQVHSRASRTPRIVETRLNPIVEIVAMATQLIVIAFRGRQRAVCNDKRPSGTFRAALGDEVMVATRGDR